MFALWLSDLFELHNESQEKKISTHRESLLLDAVAISRQDHYIEIQLQRCKMYFIN